MLEAISKILLVFALVVCILLQRNTIVSAALEEETDEDAYSEERDLQNDYEVTETEYEMQQPQTTHHPTSDDYSQEDGNKPPWWVPTWPNFRPKSPKFFDRDCFGKNKPDCIKAGGYCQWFTFQDPSCYDVRYLAVGTAPNQVGNKIPLNVKFFTFSFGVHLVEGTFQRFYYSMSVEDCAKKCLESALGLGDPDGAPRIRCLSFDFYPYEVPITQPPYDETEDTGICALNSETKDTARLRNEDQGFTNAEFFYKSHCTTRPFSALDGYYEVRDPRGGAIASMLAYSGDPLLGLSTPWGGSRWGIFHPNETGYLPPPKTQNLICTPDSSGEPPDALRFRGGFTPINLDQHCPGVMSKTAALQLCTTLGAEMCTYADLVKMQGRKLGCGYDENAPDMIWHRDIDDRGQKLFPRCCPNYNQPFSPNNAQSCTMYEPENINFCAQYKRVSDCAFFGAGIARRNTLGFGQMLETFRASCVDSGLASCKAYQLTRWMSATNCVWCPAPGLDPPGGSGECRPGGSYGICPLASLQQRQIFGIQTRGVCSDKANCELASRYPDLKPFILGASQVNPASPPAKNPTTRTPTSLPPTDSITRNPTIPGQPSSPPSAKPPTRQPNAPPVPTARRTVSPTNIPTIEPTSRPTSSVPCASYKTLWLCVGAGCKWNIKGKVDSCVDMPPEGAVLACAVYTSPPQCNSDPLNAGGCVWKPSAEGGICVRKKALRP